MSGSGRTLPWRRLALAAAGGTLLFVSQQPIGLGWLGLVAIAPLAALARDVGAGPMPVKAGIGWGTVAGLVFFLPLIEWIRFIGEFIAFPLLAGAMAVYVGLFVAGVAAWGEPSRNGDGSRWERLAAGWWRPGFVAVWWVVLEAVRGAFPLGGFPWGVLGYSQANGGVLLTSARGVGVIGVSFLCAAIGAALEEAWHRGSRAWADAQERNPSERVFAAVRTPVVTVLALLVGGIVIGGDPPEPTGETIDVAGIQGFDEDTPGTSPGRAERMASGMVEFTAQTVAAHGVPDLTVWPEAAINGDPQFIDELALAIDDGLELVDGNPLITGVDFRAGDHAFHRTMAQYTGDDDPRDGPTDDVYIKRKLVPFGEYVPLRAALDWFPPLQRTPRDALPGDTWAVFDVNGVQVAPLICYDIVTASFAREAVTNGAQILVVGTMNASYGVTGMSDQHLAFSQLRAVETGRHVVHAAVTGISGMVAPDGTITQRTGHFEETVIRADVPLVDGHTLASRLGDLPLAVLALVAVVGIGVRNVARWRLRYADGST